MNALDSNAVRRTWIFLGAITVIEAAFILAYPATFLTAALRGAGETPPLGWILAGAVTIVTVWYTARSLDLWRYLMNFSRFKSLGVAIAFPSSILEEAFFRMTIMNVLMHAQQGPVVQVIGSALTFGAVHAVWAVRGGVRSLITATLSMTVLGALLSLVFLASNRILLPCVIAHFVINLVLEPWIGYAYALRIQRQSLDRGAVHGRV